MLQYICVNVIYCYLIFFFVSGATLFVAEKRRGSFLELSSMSRKKNKLLAFLFAGQKGTLLPPIQDKNLRISMLQSLPFYCWSSYFCFHYLMTVGAVSSQVCLLPNICCSDNMISQAVSNRLFCPCLALPMASWVFKSKVSKLKLWYLKENTLQS